MQGVSKVLKSVNKFTLNKQTMPKCEKIYRPKDKKMLLRYVKIEPTLAQLLKMRDELRHKKMLISLEFMRNKQIRIKLRQDWMMRSLKLYLKRQKRDKYLYVQRMKSPTYRRHRREHERERYHRMKEENPDLLQHKRELERNRYRQKMRDPNFKLRRRERAREWYMRKRLAADSCNRMRANFSSGAVNPCKGNDPGTQIEPCSYHSEQICVKFTGPNVSKSCRDINESMQFNEAARDKSDFKIWSPSVTYASGETVNANNISQNLTTKSQNLKNREYWHQWQKAMMGEQGRKAVLQERMQDPEYAECLQGNSRLRAERASSSSLYCNNVISSRNLVFNSLNTCEDMSVVTDLSTECSQDKVAFSFKRYVVPELSSSEGEHSQNTEDGVSAARAAKRVRDRERQRRKRQDPKYKKLENEARKARYQEKKLQMKEGILKKLLTKGVSPPTANRSSVRRRARCERDLKQPIETENFEDTASESSQELPSFVFVPCGVEDVKEGPDCESLLLFPEVNLTEGEICEEQVDSEQLPLFTMCAVNRDEIENSVNVCAVESVNIEEELVAADSIKLESDEVVSSDCQSETINEEITCSKPQVFVEVKQIDDPCNGNLTHIYEVACCKQEPPI